MKLIFRYFFRTIRLLLGPIILFLDKITSPKGIKRHTIEQDKLDNITRDFKLYQFKTCPFCIKVRREIKRQSLNIKFCDAQHNQEHRQQLLEGGGKIKVPCLHVVESNGQPLWLYESDDVIRYLRKLVA